MGLPSWGACGKRHEMGSRKEWGRLGLEGGQRRRENETMGQREEGGRQLEYWALVNECALRQHEQWPVTPLECVPDPS